MKHRRMHLGRTFRKAASFCKKNSQLLVFLGVLLVGTMLGCVGFSNGFSEMNTSFFDFSPTNHPFPETFGDVIRGVVSVGFSVWVQLGLLFLLGITAFGCVFSLLGTMFFGVCLGIAECQAYTGSDPWNVLLRVTLPMAVSAVAVLVAAMQSFRLSCLFTRQLLPTGAHCGGMWQPFKRYVLVYLLCVLMSVFAALLQVLLMQ